MTSKYAEQITEIVETVARIDERTEGINKRLDKLNSSQGKQWDEINQNRSDIKVLESKVEENTKAKVATISAKAYVIAAAIAGTSAIVGGLITSWL